MIDISNAACKEANKASIDRNDDISTASTEGFDHTYKNQFINQAIDVTNCERNQPVIDSHVFAEVHNSDMSSLQRQQQLINHTEDQNNDESYHQVMDNDINVSRSEVSETRDDIPLWSDLDIIIGEQHLFIPSENQTEYWNQSVDDHQLVINGAIREDEINQSVKAHQPFFPLHDEHLTSQHVVSTTSKIREDEINQSAQVQQLSKPVINLIDEQPITQHVVTTSTVKEDEINQPIQVQQPSKPLFAVNDEHLTIKTPVFDHDECNKNDFDVFLDWDDPSVCKEPNPLDQLANEIPNEPEVQQTDVNVVILDDDKNFFDTALNAIFNGSQSEKLKPISLDNEWKLNNTKDLDNQDQLVCCNTNSQCSVQSIDDGITNSSTCRHGNCNQHIPCNESKDCLLLNGANQNVDKSCINQLNEPDTSYFTSSDLVVESNNSSMSTKLNNQEVYLPKSYTTDTSFTISHFTGERMSGHIDIDYMNTIDCKNHQHNENGQSIKGVRSNFDILQAENKGIFQYDLSKVENVPTDLPTSTSSSHNIQDSSFDCHEEAHFLPISTDENNNGSCKLECYHSIFTSSHAQKHQSSMNSSGKFIKNLTYKIKVEIKFDYS